MSTGRSAETARISEAEFLALPQSLERLELIDGEIIVSPSPSPLHQRVVQLLGEALLKWERIHPPAMVGVAPLDVRLKQGRIVQPDLFICAGGFSLDEGPIDVAPDLTVEVLSSQSTYDRFAKRALYAQAGVREYWLVDPVARTVEIVAGLDTLATESGLLLSRSLPDLEVDLQALFAEATARRH